MMDVDKEDPILDHAIHYVTYGCYPVDDKGEEASNESGGRQRRGLLEEERAKGIYIYIYNSIYIYIYIYV